MATNFLLHGIKMGEKRNNSKCYSEDGKSMHNITDDYFPFWEIPKSEFYNFTVKMQIKALSKLLMSMYIFNDSVTWWIYFSLVDKTRTFFKIKYEA